MILTNQEILEYISLLDNSFLNNNEVYIPVKVNFYIQKNIKNLKSYIEDIDKARLRIIKHYADIDNETNEFVIKKEEDIAIVNKEFQDLLELKQDVDIHLIPLKELNEVKLTTPQLNSILFMITEEE